MSLKSKALNALKRALKLPKKATNKVLDRIEDVHRQKVEGYKKLQEESGLANKERASRLKTQKKRYKSFPAPDVLKVGKRKVKW